MNTHKGSAVQSAPTPLRNWASKLSKTNLLLNQQGQNSAMPIRGRHSRPRMTETCKVTTWVKVSVNRTRVGRQHPRRRSCRPSSADAGARSGSSRSAAWTAGSAGRSCPPSTPWSDTSSASTPRSTSPPSSSTSRTPRAKTRSSRTPRGKETTAVQRNTPTKAPNSRVAALDPSPAQNPVRAKMKRSKRPDLDSLLCPTCGVKFENRNRLYHHHRRCAWKVCHLCGKSVKNLDNHLMRHNAPRRFPCKHCPKGFISRGRLRAHLRRHRGERTFCCEICGKCFFERGPLAEHLLLHAGCKPFKCHLCDSAFTRGRGLKDHMRVHTGEKPYKCHICNRPFSSTGNLAAHRRNIHKMEPLLPFGAQKLTGHS